METNDQQRTWYQIDFNELYNQQPTIITKPTYTVINLFLQSTILKVKIPTTASSHTTKYLLHKAIYFHYLDQKHPNPLFKTASISSFQSTTDSHLWYNLWAFGNAIPKRHLLCCVEYCEEQSIGKYQPMTILERREQYCNVLARSKKDGKYYQIYIYSHKKVKQQYINFLHTTHQYFQHPFLFHLIQIHKTSSQTYFIFYHNPFSFSAILSSNYIFTNQQIQTYVVQLVLALIFIEQQHIRIRELQFDMIDIDVDGHLVLNQKLLHWTNSSDQSNFEKNPIKFVLQFFNTLLSKTEQITQHQRIHHNTFRTYLEQLSQTKPISLKQLLNHPWIQCINLQNIVMKNRIFHQIQNTCLKFQFRKLTAQQYELFFCGYSGEHDKYPKSIYYSSDQMYQQSKQQIVYHKYFPIKQKNMNNFSNLRLTKINSSIFKPTKTKILLRQSINTRNDVTKQKILKSPYFSQLVKNN